MTPRPAIAVDPLEVLARSLPPSRYRPGRSGARIGWLLAIGILTTLVVGLVIGPRTICSYGYSKADIASLTIKKYAAEAYPQFRAANPERTCPVAMRELNEWMNSKDIQDPWGTAYTMTCSDKGILVGSAGEDGVFDTADDVWSNE